MAGRVKGQQVESPRQTQHGKREAEESGWQKMNWSQCGGLGLEARRLGKDSDLSGGVLGQT